MLSANPSRSLVEREASVVIDHRTGRRGDMGEWVDAFAQVWAAPRQELDRLMALLDRDIVLVAPSTPPRSVGQAAGRKAFERAFRAMPDLRATVRRWSATDEVLFIEMTFHATIGGREVAWDDVDRILFKDGRAIERIAYFDPTPVRKAFTKNLRAMGQLMRMRMGR